MKLTTARKLVCMSYFTVDGLRPLLATATRIVCSGDTKRFLFPDGSVIESNKGNWKVVDMKKNPKLEAAVRRFGNGQKLPVAPFVTGGYTGAPKDEIAGVVREPASFVYEGNPRPSQLGINTALFTEGLETPGGMPKEERMRREIVMLNALLNEKDEQLDKASRPMVVRLDWWAVALVAVVLVAHYVFKAL